MSTAKPGDEDNLKLLGAIPASARRILELGCGDGRLGRRFRQMRPGVQWWGVDASADALRAAAPHLDRVIELDVDVADLSVLEGGFDTIVIGSLLPHLRHPERVLDALYDLTSAGAHIVCRVQNIGHLSVIERLVGGDISDGAAGLLDASHNRFYTPSSAFKVFLDSGWLPHVADARQSALPSTPFAALIVDAARALGLPAATAARNLGLEDMTVVCRKWPMESLVAPGPRVPFSVIVAVNRPWQYEQNIARSPGLMEIGAEVICIEGASSAAAAYEMGASRASHAWRVMAHQDVYFPTGSGYALAQQLGALEQAGLSGVPVGFAGIEATGAAPGQMRHAGMVIDRRSLFWHGPSAAAVSLDEFAIGLHRDSVVSIDPALGWHLWATDLCLQVQQLAGQPLAQILNVPLFHNSVADFKLPDDFQASAIRLRAKYPQLKAIPTLCGNIDATFTAQRPATPQNQAAAGLSVAPQPAVPVANDPPDTMITTLIPAYKVQYIPELLSCLASQNYKKFRVIISDDSPNNEVTAVIRQLQMKGLASGLSLSIVEGPKKGAHANLLHLLKTWNNSSPLVHFLFDDDLIYPSFYQMHVTAHSNAKISASVSYRWIGDETGAPAKSPGVPEFIANSNTRIELLNADKIFQSTVPYCTNWLGEFSNSVFTSTVINIYHEQTLSGINYYGLGDIGLLLQASLSSDIAIIKEHLGVFRMNPHQNTGNFASVSFRCGYVAWIALALASYALGKISQQQAKQAIESISKTISVQFQGVEEILQFSRLHEVFDVGSAEFKSSFEELWHDMLMTDTSWVSTQP
jgi:SAM-dependent methyltransferase